MKAGYPELLGNGILQLLSHLRPTSEHPDMGKALDTFLNPLTRKIFVIALGIALAVAN